MHDYSPFTSAFTLITQCLIVLLYPCSVVVVFCCYAPVYITVCTSCNNLQLTISVQSYNAYRYIGDPDVPRSLVRSAPAATLPVTARCPMPLPSSRRGTRPTAASLGQLGSGPATVRNQRAMPAHLTAALHRSLQSLTLPFPLPLPLPCLLPLLWRQG